MFKEFWNDSFKAILFIILVILEVPAAVTLIVWWIKDSQEAKKRDKRGGKTE